MEEPFLLKSRFFQKVQEQWVATDFVVLVEATRPAPEACMTLQMELPARDNRPAHVGRAILGPVAHLQQHPAADASGDSCPRSEGAAEEHSFCPCCLLTRSFDAFKDLWKADGFFAQRLLAARFEDGIPQANCRVNGQDWERGAEALRRYVTTWPNARVEFRKQYVVLHTLG
jgi:hypothetical protein